MTTDIQQNRGKLLNERVFMIDTGDALHTFACLFHFYYSHLTHCTQEARELIQNLLGEMLVNHYLVHIYIFLSHTYMYMHN